MLNMNPQVFVRTPCHVWRSVDKPKTAMKTMVEGTLGRYRSRLASSGQSSSVQLALGPKLMRPFGSVESVDIVPVGFVVFPFCLCDGRGVWVLLE